MVFELILLKHKSVLNMLREILHKGRFEKKFQLYMLSVVLASPPPEN